MAITFGTCTPAAPCLYDAKIAPTTGAVCQGIGLKGADGAALAGAQYIGNPYAPNINFDTDGNTATP